MIDYPHPEIAVTKKQNRKPKAKGSKQQRSAGSQARAPRRRPRGRSEGGEMRTIGAASAYSAGQISRAPVIKATRDSCRVVHRELITSVVDSLNFAIVNAFHLNPGLRATFPWLSTQAVGWQSYRFNSLRFCYYTRCSTATPGSIMLIPEYDAGDTAPQSEQIASSYEDVAEDAPWKSIVAVMKPAAMDTIGPRHFIRTGGVPVGQDIKLFDVGQLFVAAVDGAGATPVGKLWVEYDVTFYTPQLPPGGTDCASGLLVGATTLSAANPWGLAPVAYPNGLTPTVFGGNGLLLPDATDGDEYLIVLDGVGTVITAVAATILGGGAIVTTLFSGFPAAALTYCVVLTVRVTDAANFVLQLALTATTITAGRVSVFEMPFAAPY